jgi:hypothetical protein
VPIQAIQVYCEAWGYPPPLDVSPKSTPKIPPLTGPLYRSKPATHVEQGAHHSHPFPPAPPPWKVISFSCNASSLPLLVLSSHPPPKRKGKRERTVSVLCLLLTFSVEKTPPGGRLSLARPLPYRPFAVLRHHFWWCSDVADLRRTPFFSWQKRENRPLRQRSFSLESPNRSRNTINRSSTLGEGAFGSNRRAQFTFLLFVNRASQPRCTATSCLG